MMFNYKKSICIFLLVFLCLINQCALGVQETFEESKLKNKVLIVYDREKYFSYSDNLLNSIVELLGALNTNVQTLNVEDYKKGCMNNFSYLFVLGIDGEFNKEEFLQDLSEYKNEICWIGRGIEYLLQRNSKDEKYKLAYEGRKQDITEVYYSNERKKNINYKQMNKFYMESKESFTVVKPLDSSVKIFSYISNGGQYYPYAINTQNLWHIARVDDNSVLFYIFSDLLNDIFKVQPMKKGKTFIRIEDVHPFRDVDKLKEIADYLYSEDIPFMVALIPTFVDTKTGYVNTLSQRKEFVDAIKYMQQRGGTVILHGYTHQNIKEEASGEGFEFWNGQKDEPLDVDMEKYVYDKVGLALKECIKNGIYPLGFEAPHYAMDIRGYKEIKKYFSTYVGQYQSSNKRFTTTAFPYVIYNTEAFNKLIPENLGYMETENILSLKNIQENFRQISQARGYTAGVFFHCYLDIEKLKEIVDYLKSQQVEFLDLKKEDNWVKWDHIQIKSHKGKIEVKHNIKEQIKEGMEDNKSKSLGYISNINFILTIVISIFCVVFLIIFLISKRRDKNKFLR